MSPIHSILLVEDDPDDQSLFKEAVKQISEVTMIMTAVNGEDALEYLSSTIVQPDLIVSDINMPVMDGFKFLQAVKQHETCSDIPVYILTTSASQMHEKLGLKLGAEKIMVKPSDFVVLVQLIRGMLEDFRAR